MSYQRTCEALKAAMAFLTLLSRDLLNQRQG